MRTRIDLPVKISTVPVRQQYKNNTVNVLGKSHESTDQR